MSEEYLFYGVAVAVATVIISTYIWRYRQYRKDQGLAPVFKFKRRRYRDMATTNEENNHEY